MKLQGSFPAMITPFKDGELDEESLRGLVRFLIKGGSAGIVACGSTGEAATLTSEEYRRVVSIAIEESYGEVPVIAGVSANATWKAAMLAREAETVGADALLVLCPYYNKPTQEGLFRHFKEVSRAVSVPIVLYNIPGRTAVNMLPETVARLARACENIVAVKESSGSIDQVGELLRVCPKGFTVLSGDDSLTLPMLALGAKGVVSVVANLAPKQFSRMCDLALKGDFAAARDIHFRLLPLMKALFVETNPIPVKFAASRLKLCRDEVRLPLTPLTRKSSAAVTAALKTLA